MNILYFLLIGLAAGWIAGQLMKARQRSLGSNLLLGVIGALLGGLVLGLLGFHSNGSLLGSLITATLGAVLLLWVVNYFSRH